MQLLIGFILLALAVPIAHAESLEIVSPSHAYTFAYGDAVSHQIEHDQFTNEMIARVTFSNYPFAGDCDPRRDEVFDFVFPGLRFDADTKGIFRARVGSHAASNCGIASEFSVCRLQARADRENLSCETQRSCNGSVESRCATSRWSALAAGGRQLVAAELACAGARATDTLGKFEDPPRHVW